MTTLAQAPPRLLAVPQRVHEAIAEATRRLIAEFQPQQLWLFGSYAWGVPTDESDLDLLVVVAGLPRGRRARLETLRPVEEAMEHALQNWKTIT